MALRLTEETLLNNKRDYYPKLVLPTEYRLEYLYRRYRVLIVKEALILLDKWWIIDLYLVDRYAYVFVIL